MSVSKNTRSTPVMFRCPNDLLAVIDALCQKHAAARTAIIIEALRQTTGTPRTPLALKINTEKRS